MYNQQPMAKSPENKIIHIYQKFPALNLDNHAASVIEECFKYEDYCLYPKLIKYPSGAGNIADAHREIISTLIENRLLYNIFQDKNESPPILTERIHFTDSDSYGIAFFYNPNKINEDKFIDIVDSSINYTNNLLLKLNNSNKIQPIK